MQVDKRIQVYIRNRGQTVADGNEFKTEQFASREELYETIISFIEGVLDELEEGV